MIAVIVSGGYAEGQRGLCAKEIVMQATIKKSKSTKDHRASLESKGYEVSENETHLLVEVSEVVDGEVDLTTEEGLEQVREAIAQKKGFSYKTKWLIPGESRSHSGIFAVRKLGGFSSLVMKGPEAPKKPSASAVISAEMDSIFENL